MRAQIAFLDSVTATFKFGGKVIVPELVFSGTEFSFHPHAPARRCSPHPLNTLVMPFASLLRGVGNRAYGHAFALYVLCYRVFKAYTDRPERHLLRSILSRELSWWMRVQISVFIRSFSPAVSVLLALFIPSSRRPENFSRLQSATSKLANVRVSQAAVGEHSDKSTL